MVEMTIELRRKIADRLGLATHTVRRSTQTGGRPLAAHHRAALEEFGIEVADLLCPIRERVRKGEKPPRKQPAWAEVLMQVKAMEARVAKLEVDANADRMGWNEGLAQAEERLDRLEGQQ